MKPRTQFTSPAAPTPLIRPSVDTDIDAITAFYGGSVATDTASWEYVAPTVEEMAERRRVVLENGYPFLVATLDDRVVGYAYASSYRARVGYRFVVEDSIYVSSDAQGRGIGKMLLMALIAECEKSGFRQMIAVIGDSENAASIALHARCGFQHAARFSGIGYKFGRWLDSVQMIRALGTGSSTPPDVLTD